MDRRFPQLAPQTNTPVNTIQRQSPALPLGPLVEWLAFGTLVLFLLRG